MKQLAKRLLFGDGLLPAHVAVGLCDAARIVRVTLRGLDATLDVSGDHVPVSLRPFTIGLCLDDSIGETALRHARLHLAFTDWTDDRTERGRLSLTLAGSIALGRHRLWLFDVAQSANRCLPTLHVYTREWRDWWGRRRRNNPYNFRMTAADLRAINVYYMRPRPVSLVTVVDGAASNVFPMDLIGPVSSGHFLLALRSTSPAVELMTHVRRIAVSAVPASFKDTAYALGAHHRERSIDWNSLAFETAMSPEFGLPVPRDALLVRELDIRDVHTIGSHTLFVSEVARQTRGTGGDTPALCHIAGPLAYVRQIDRLP